MARRFCSTAERLDAASPGRTCPQTQSGPSWHHDLSGSTGGTREFRAEAMSLMIRTVWGLLVMLNLARGATSTSLDALIGLGRLGLALGACALLGTLHPASADSPPTPSEYIAHVGGDAKLVPAGALTLDGNRMICGHRPTVLDDNLDDYAAAYPGFLIVNPKLMNRVSTPVKMWIFSHECAHQFRGPDEDTADCFAVQRGRRQGWLTEQGLDEVCAFIKPAKGDMMHLSGSNRCESMRRCFKDPKVR